jgi:hypothetical protein
MTAFQFYRNYKIDPNKWLKSPGTMDPYVAPSLECLLTVLQGIDARPLSISAGRMRMRPGGMLILCCSPCGRDSVLLKCIALLL